VTALRTPSPFRLTVTCPRGTVLVGGYSSVPEELDAVHARRADGRAIIPASALRGALREGLEALLRGAGQPACAGGDGVDPAAAEGAPDPQPCTLDGGQPCVACRLFGTRRDTLPAGQRTFSGLVVGDAVAPEPTETTIRHGVSLDRRRRSARTGLLFNRELPLLSTQDGSPHFVAEGRLTDPTLRDAFLASTRITQHLGSGRSRGLGRIDLAVEWLESAGGAAPSAEFDAEGVDLLLTLDSPACVGQPFGWENLRSSRTEIPGSALRGMVGFALAEALQDADDDAFQQLVEAETGAIFDFAFPTTVETQGQWAAPWPLTARVCKRHAAEHAEAARDGLVDRLLLTLADGEAEARVAQVIAKTGERGCTASDCGAPLKARAGWRMRDADASIATRVVTRLALDRRRRSARQGALYQTEVLEPGLTFRTSVRRLPAGTADRLALALQQPLSVGAGRSRGWGQLSVEVAPRKARDDLAPRQRRFRQAVERRAQALGVQLDARRYVAVTLLAPLLPDGADDDGAGTLAAALDLDVSGCALRVRRFGYENGWDQRAGRRAMVRSVVAGSVFVFDLGEAATDAHLRTMRDLETDGAGLRRTQGFGRVLFFDPALLIEPTDAGVKG
jgi:CRISPR-associated Csx10 family RAMP protein